MKIQWYIQPSPEFFDHHIDLYYQFLDTRNPLWCERGCFGNLAISPGSELLELCCGDGFNTRNFYSTRCRSIVACDFDKNAIRAATKYNKHDNIRFLLADIRTGMPDGRYDNIVWDAAIEHFTPEEICVIMGNIKRRLKDTGVLSGYTIVEKADHTMHIHQHEYEFRDKQDLLRFLSPHFKRCMVFETRYHDRHNLYFWASDAVIPFSSNWESMAQKQETSA